MKRIAIPALCALALAGAPAPSPVPATPAGPGRVYLAVQDLLSAIDRGDAEHLRTAFVAERHGVEMCPTAESGLETERSSTPFEFWDRDADGGAIRAGSVDDVLGAVEALADPQRGRPTSTITSFVGECPSEHCSYGVVEFERVWGEGDDVHRVAMRATALVRWVGGEKGPQMRVMHWHASPAGS